MSVYLNHVENFLRNAGISVSMFAVVSGVPQATLQACLRGRLTMGGEKELELYKLAQRCAEVADAVRPLVFEKGNSASVKALAESSLTADKIRAVVGQLFNSEE